MKLNKYIPTFLLIFLLSLCIGTVFAENVSSDYNSETIESEYNGMNEIESDLDESMEISDDSIYEEDLYNNVKLKDPLKSKEDNTLDINYVDTHDESHNIIVDVKPGSTKAKVGDEIPYTITVTNKNPFTVLYLEVYTPVDEEVMVLNGKSNSSSYVGFVDQAYWIIEKLKAGETIVIDGVIKVVDVGNTNLSVGIYHNFPPYESIEYESNSNGKNVQSINTNENYEKEGLDLAKNKTANPIFLLFISLCSIFSISMINKKKY